MLGTMASPISHGPRRRRCLLLLPALLGSAFRQHLPVGFAAPGSSFSAFGAGHFVAGPRAPPLAGAGWRGAPGRSPQVAAERRGQSPPPRRRLKRMSLGLLGALALGLLLPGAAFASHSVVLEGPVQFGTLAKFFAAGGVGCSLSHAFATPLDVIKTRLQSNPDKYVHARTGAAMSPVSTCIRIIRDEGPGALLKGMGSTFIGYLFQGAVKYGLWETLKWEMGFGLAAGPEKVLILLAAALIAELFASLVLCPFERIRIQLVADPGFAQGGVINNLMERIRRDGWSAALYGDGLPATLVKQSCYTVTKLTGFALFSMTLSDFMGPAVTRFQITLIGSLLAGFVAAIASQPGDTLQICTSTNSRLRESCPIDWETGGQPNLWYAARMMGMKVLFTGWRARLLHVEVIVVSQLLIYDLALHSMGL